MPLPGRAAQFAPFAALTGYEAAIRETARLTGGKIELGEDMEQELDRTIRQIAGRPFSGCCVTVTHFVPDARKSGGAYIKTLGDVKRVDEYERMLVLKNGVKIPFGNILRIEANPEGSCGE